MFDPLLRAFAADKRIGIACGTCFEHQNGVWVQRFGTGAPEVGAPPEIAVTMFLAHSLHGYTASGYVAEAINFYLDRKYGREFERWATPRFRFLRGLPEIVS